MDIVDMDGKQCVEESLSSGCSRDSLVNGDLIVSSGNGDKETSRDAKRRYLTPRQVQSLVNAFIFAESIGKPLNGTIDIVWLQSHRWRTESDFQKAQTLILHRLSTFLNNLGVGFYCVWTRENGRRQGPHIHIMIHLPEPLREDVFNLILSQGEFDKHGVRVKTVMNTEDMRQGRFRYNAKNIEPSASIQFGHHTPSEIVDRFAGLLSIIPEPGGYLHGKRAGTSESLGLAARKRHQQIEFEIVNTGKGSAGDDVQCHGTIAESLGRRTSAATTVLMLTGDNEADRLPMGARVQDAPFDDPLSRVRSCCQPQTHLQTRVTTNPAFRPAENSPSVNEADFKVFEFRPERSNRIMRRNTGRKCVNTDVISAARYCYNLRKYAI